MRRRLSEAKPREVSSKPLVTWYIYTDASYEVSTSTGGLGAVLVDEAGECVSWFGLPLDAAVCTLFGSLKKETIIYELELAAAVLSFLHWRAQISSGMQVWFGDNDSVRFSFIRGSAVGIWASHLIRVYLQLESAENFLLWFARVPTECNISDFPSRFAKHPLLLAESDCSASALLSLMTMLDGVRDLH